MQCKYPETLQALISHLKKLPGVGLRTAERFAFELLRWKPEQLAAFGLHLSALPQNIISCPTCGCLQNRDESACQFCNPSLRDPTSLCILSSPRDVYSIEETRAFKGLYHVIEHLLSPLDGRHASSLRIDRIGQRIEQHGIKEVILAFDSTLEGDTTALYLKEQLASYSISISRLAFGLPVGSSLEYIDGGTLARALFGRQTV
jgi:recombination protein RecR